MSDSQDQTKLPVNHIRVSAGTSVRSVLRYSNMLLRERNLRELHFSGLGGAIGKIVSSVEILKLTNPGLYQLNNIETVTYSTKDNQNNLVSERLFPRIQVILTLDEPKNKGVGFQEKINEEDRVRLFNLASETRKRPPNENSRPPQRGGVPRPQRGGRGQRGGGQRGGAFRGGAFRGGPRGGRGRRNSNSRGGQRKVAPGVRNGNRSDVGNYGRGGREAYNPDRNGFGRGNGFQRGRGGRRIQGERGGFRGRFIRGARVN